MPAFTKSPDVISIPEAASRGYACEATLRRHVRAGRLPSVRIRHRIWLRISDLDAYFGLAAISPVDGAISIVEAHLDDLDEARRARLSALLGGDAA